MFVAAHRGTRLHAPENTLHALLAGYAAGGQTIEFDLQLTADGQVVLHHDGTVNRMTGREDAEDLRIIDHTLAELRQLDYSPGFAAFRQWPQFRHFHDSGDRVGIVTFEEALDALPVEIPLLIELKHDSTETTGRRDEFVEKAVQILRSRGAVERSVTYSKDAETVRRILQVAPELRACAFDYGGRYAEDPMEYLALMKEAGADGLVLQLSDVFDPDGVLTDLGRGLRDVFDSGEIRVGAVLYPFRGPGIPWIISPEEYAAMERESFIWSCASDSMIAVEEYVRRSFVFFEESFAGTEEDTDRVAFGYAKANRFCHVYQDSGVHVQLDPYDGPSGPAGSEDPVESRLEDLEEQMLYARGTWPYYSGGGVGVRAGIEGSFAAEVDYEIREPMTQAVTLEMAALNVDPGDHQAPWIVQDGERRRAPVREHDTFFDPHGGPPYVGVEHDENDGYRINWNLGTQYDNNRYGRPVGDGQTAQSGRLRLERRGAYFAAYYRNDTDAPDWVCVGAVRNDNLADRVFLRCVAKRWRQRKSGGGYHPIRSNEIVFRNLTIRRFAD